jgi:hypothetical protein
MLHKPLRVYPNHHPRVLSKQLLAVLTIKFTDDFKNSWFRLGYYGN